LRLSKSASYSSTQSVMTPPSTSSPTTTTRSSLSLSYPSMTSRALSPGLAAAPAGLDDLRPGTLHHASQMLPPAPSHLLPHWQPQPASAYPSSYTAPSGLATHHPSTGRTWDIPYLDTGGGAASSSASQQQQVIPYHRGAGTVSRTSEPGAESDDHQQQQHPASSYG
jgi:hypothetical protein